MNLENKIPIVNWPDESGDLKVVQLDVDGKPYLRIADWKYTTHARMLETLAEDLGREFPTIEKRAPDNTAYTLPKLESEWYKVYGMGWVELDVNKKEATFYGTSYDYKIGIDEEHLNNIKSKIKDWNLLVKE
jgi:hypothetical protein